MFELNWGMCQFVQAMYVSKFVAGENPSVLWLEFVQESGILSSSQKKLIGARGYRVAPCVRTLALGFTPGRATFHSSEIYFYNTKKL